MLCATVMMQIAEPSGGDLAQSSMPMLPPAPARLSATNWTPYALVSVSAAKRPMMSVGPPGGKGMITRTGLVGHCCACAAHVQRIAAVAATAIVLNVVMEAPREARRRIGGTAGHYAARTMIWQLRGGDL